MNRWLPWREAAHAPLVQPCARGRWGISPPLLAANLVCVVGSMMFVFTPLVIDALRHGRTAASERQIAFIGSSDVVGMFLGAIIALYVVPRFNRRRLASLGIGALCLGNAIALVTSDFSMPLYCSRILAGAGGGLAMGVGYAAFAAADEPERNVALFSALQTAVGSAAFLGLALLIPAYGVDAVYGGSLVFSAIALAFTAAIDPSPVGVRPTVIAEGKRLLDQSCDDGGTRGVLIPLTIVTYFLFGALAIAIWGNVEGIGKSFGLSHTAASAAVSASLLACVAGSLLVVFMGKCRGRGLPTTIMAFTFLLGVYLLYFPHGFFGFLAAAAAFQFGTNVGFPAFGALAEADPAGYLSSLYLLSLKAGFAFGPVAASWLLGDGDYRRVILAGLVMWPIVCALLCVILWVARRLKIPSTPNLSQSPPSARPSLSAP